MHVKEGLDTAGLSYSAEMCHDHALNGSYPDCSGTHISIGLEPKQCWLLNIFVTFFFLVPGINLMTWCLPGSTVLLVWLLNILNINPALLALNF